MIVYHGGEQAVEVPDLVHSRKAVDFGLRYEKPNLQICFRTPAALATLEFIGSENA